MYVLEIKGASKASNHFPVGNCKHSALLDGSIHAVEGNTAYPVKSHKTYGLNARLYFGCNYGFWRDGPEVVTCTASGAWKPNTPTLCRPSNKNKNYSNYCYYENYFHTFYS